MRERAFALTTTRRLKGIKESSKRQTLIISFLFLIFYYFHRAFLKGLCYFTVYFLFILVPIDRVTSFQF